MRNLMRFAGQEVIIHGRDGTIHRGVMMGMDPPRGIFIFGFFGRRFVPFVFIAAIFTVRGRRRIF